MRVLTLLLALTGLAHAEGALWNPASDAWSDAAIGEMVRTIQDAPIAGDFLADVEMAPFGTADWAWFADDFDPDDYGSVALAPPRNSMGRYHATGQELLRDSLAKRMKTYGPTVWKKAYTEGTEADLVLYTNIRSLKLNKYEFQLVVELVAVDRDDRVVAQVQTLGGGAALAAAILNSAQGSVFGVIPNEKEQLDAVKGTIREIVSKLQGPFTGAYKRIKKGERTFPSGAAASLPLPRAQMIDQKADTLGPAVQEQVREQIAIVLDEEAKTGARRQAARNLGKIGSIAIVTELADFVTDKKANTKVRTDVVWALGEVGHPDALPLLKGAKGVSGKSRRASRSRWATRCTTGATSPSPSPGSDL
jgi:hypothetical protein